MMHFNTDGTRTPKFEEMSALEKLTLFAFGFKRPRPQNHQNPASLDIPFEDITIKGEGNRSIHMWKIPGIQSQPIFVLFHGFGGNLEKMLPALKILHEEGYSCYMVEIPGSGGSSGNQTTIGILEAGDVKTAFEYIRKENRSRKVVLFGSSMGAAAITRAVALSSIQPDGLILESPFDSFLETLKNRFHRLKVPTFPLSHLITGWIGILTGTNAFDHEPAEFIKRAKMPILLLHGEKDHNVTSQQIKRIYENITSPKIFQVFPDVGHKFFAQTHPKIWKSSLTTFLRVNRLSRNLESLPQ